ncbi:MAG: hypothetical protein KDB04_17080 [Acidimicrobiales bacterium]|nr:hypothetical protein [Acidimicrobiales bacterium]HRW39827.1 hypothetical protein [Aquihabitans sp.]
MGRWTQAVAAIALAGASLWWSWRWSGPDGVAFAVVVVWAPMLAVGAISQLAPIRLPARWYELRPFERDGRLYERLGVRAAKRVARRGPIAAFNPDLHLPREPTGDGVRHLERRMRDAESSHVVVFLAVVLVTVHAVVKGWWTAAIVSTVANLAMNGAPVALQRYNRALLRRRFPEEPAERP